MLAFDIRDALRGLARDRLYSAIVVLTLALTIGATTAVFSIVNGVLLKPLPYEHPEQLVAIDEIWRQFSDRYPTVPTNVQHFGYWREHNRSFSSIAQYLPLPANLTGTGEATEITAVRTSSSLFELLGARAAIGRVLAAGDERPGAPAVAVLADRLWTARFGGDPRVIGRTIALDGKACVVVGVMPPGFRIPGEGQLTDQFDALVPLVIDGDASWVGEHNTRSIGRLRPGVTAERARVDLETLQAQISAIATREAHETVTLGAQVTPLAELIVGKARQGLLLLFAAIVAVLLIACSNLANLSLTRTLARLRESAIRSALGAGRLRLISRLLIEHVVLAAAGGAGGLLLAGAALGAFVRTAPVDLPRVAEITLDARVLACSAALSLAAALLVAILPAWHLAASDVHDQLRGGITSTDTPGRLRTRSALVLLQIGVSVTLLVTTSLLLLSLFRVLRADPGFEPARTLAVDLVLPLNRYPAAAQRAQVAGRVLDEVRAIPGVSSAAWAHMLPLTGHATVNFIIRDDDPRPFTQQPPANYRYVSADYFKTAGIPLRRGQVFADADRNETAVPAVITERTASRIWPGVDPIGRQFRWNPDKSEKPVTVVGVVADTKTTIDGEPPLMVYMPYWYRPRASTSLVVRSSGDPLSVASTVRQAIHRIDPDIAIATVRPMQQLVDRAVAGRRYQVRLFVAFGALALGLATLGVYAVAAYGISRRRREMNIRVALGATHGHVRGLVLRQSVTPLGAGIVFGVAAALASGRAVASLLYGVSARDPVVIGLVSLVVGTVAVVATLVAIRQGLALNPASALRDE